MFGIALYDIFFFGIPGVLLLLLGISLYRFIKAKKENREQPGTHSPREMKKRAAFLIVMAVIVGVLVAVVVGFIALLFMAVAYM